MNRWLKALVVAGLAVSAGVVSRTAALADTPGDEIADGYAQAMWYFLPQVGRYADKLDATLSAVEVKPEMASDLEAMAQQGATFVADLEGTPVPAEMQDAHERLLAALRQLDEAAQIGADDPAGARYLYDGYEPLLQGARQDIRDWLMAGIEIGGATVTPATPVIELGQ